MASRKGYDLFTRSGRQHFYEDFRRHYARQLVWGDTFGQIGCLVLGHNEYMTEDDSIACRRCHKYLPNPGEQGE